MNDCSPCPHHGEAPDSHFLLGVVIMMYVIMNIKDLPLITVTLSQLLILVGERDGVVARGQDYGPRLNSWLSHHDLFFCVLEQTTQPYLLLSTQE